MGDFVAVHFEGDSQKHVLPISFVFGLKEEELVSCDWDETQYWVKWINDETSSSEADDSDCSGQENDDDAEYYLARIMFVGSKESCTKFLADIKSNAKRFSMKKCRHFADPNPPQTKQVIHNQKSSIAVEQEKRKKKKFERERSKQRSFKEIAMEKKKSQEKRKLEKGERADLSSPVPSKKKKWSRILNSDEEGEPEPAKSAASITSQVGPIPTNKSDLTLEEAIKQIASLKLEVRNLRSENTTLWSLNEQHQQTIASLQAALEMFQKSRQQAENHVDNKDEKGNLPAIVPSQSLGHPSAEVCKNLNQGSLTSVNSDEGDSHGPDETKKIVTMNTVAAAPTSNRDFNFGNGSVASSANIEKSDQDYPLFAKENGKVYIGLGYWMTESAFSSTLLQANEKKAASAVVFHFLGNDMAYYSLTGTPSRRKLSGGPESADADNATSAQMKKPIPPNLLKAAKNVVVHFLKQKGLEDSAINQIIGEKGKSCWHSSIVQKCADLARQLKPGFAQRKKDMADAYREKKAIKAKA